MGDWPNVQLPPFKTVTPAHPEALGESSLSAWGSFGSGTVTQNQAYFFPFRLDQGRTAAKMAVFNGATANGNTDVAIYDGQFNFLVGSGATLQSGTSQLQEFDITDTDLSPGLYWMAISTSSATATFFRTAPNADEFAVSSYPVYQQASAHPLPTTTATPVITTEATPIILIQMCVSFDTLI